jgi:hypothetical protein
MGKKSSLVLACLVLFTIVTFSQEDYLKIDTTISPRYIKQGEEGVLKIKIKPKNGIKISSQLGFMIELDKNPNLSLPKVFFTASELDLQSKQVDDTVYLELEKEIPIPFKVNESSLIGKHTLRGKVFFTAVFDKDKWSLKTYQKFNVDFFSRRNNKLKKK